MESNPQYLHLVAGSGLPALARQPTRAVLVLDQPVDPIWQRIVSSWLIEIGCLYMLAWGDNCSSWDDSVDIANHEPFGSSDIPEEADAMTTWHADEPLSECMWFAKNCATHSLVDLERTIILHIGPAPRERELVQAYAEA
ncbi:DUF7684 family protein [Solilutibacter oculi]